MRVPGIVIGPHVKRGYVSHKQYDYCSILSTLYNRFDLSSNDVGWLNNRVLNTLDLADCIDPDLAIKGAPLLGPAAIPVLEFSESQ